MLCARTVVRGIALSSILLLTTVLALCTSNNVARVPGTGSLAALRLDNPLTTKLHRGLQRSRFHGRGRVGFNMPHRLYIFHLPARRGHKVPGTGSSLLLHSVTIKTPCGARHVPEVILCRCGVWGRLG